MKKSYNLKKLKWVSNPYVRRKKKSVTIRVDDDVLAYFQKLSETSGVPYQTLMNMFLRSCKQGTLNPKIEWVKST